jgi:hypothetical protein
MTVAIGSDVDHYEFLQISPRAEWATIQRVYRLMASRFHPDHPATGDSEKFLFLKHASEVLSDPERRAEYDAKRESREVRPNPIFEMSEFVNGIEGETNRRLSVLSLLYTRCRTNPEDPRISLYDLESGWDWPREYLDFTTWYLRSMQYITREDNSDFALTATGLNYLEANSTKIPVLNKLLNSGARTATSTASPTSDERPNSVGELLDAAHHILGRYRQSQRENALVGSESHFLLLSGECSGGIAVSRLLDCCDLPVSYCHVDADALLEVAERLLIRTSRQLQ